MARFFVKGEELFRDYSGVIPGYSVAAFRDYSGFTLTAFQGYSKAIPGRMFSLPLAEPGRYRRRTRQMLGRGRLGSLVLLPAPLFFLLVSLVL